MFILMDKNNKIENFITIEKEDIQPFEKLTGITIKEVADGFPLQIGDTYDGENFWRDGEIVKNDEIEV